MQRDAATQSEFIARHIGPSQDDQRAMLAAIGVDSLDALVHEVAPGNILSEPPYLNLPEPMSEVAALAQIRGMARRNQVLRSYIGQGYYGTHVPHVILRNILENPAWYTAYTPYQPEISQGRLEALLVFQTMVCDLTGLDIANASLLDEGTAAAEAMTLARRVSRAKSEVFFVSQHVHPQTIEVMRTRAAGLGIVLDVGDEALGLPECFGVLLQYPHSLGGVADYRALAQQAHEAGAIVAVATDLLALALLSPPGEWGADIAVGSAQRFGVPMGYGGPHAGFMACKDAWKRNLPGRLVGVSQDARGEPALRLALQTREQHIRREKATSNICTAQVLLAVMAAMYAVWHGPQGIARIAQRVAGHTARLANALRAMALDVCNDSHFDTLCVRTGGSTQAVLDAAIEAGINLRRVSEACVALSLDETVQPEDLEALVGVFAAGTGQARIRLDFDTQADGVPLALRRTGPILAHPAFSRVQSETDMLRYLRQLSDKDLALDRTMIPLGSCTMKLNATAEMIPITWPEFGDMHPFAPAGQAQGYQALIQRLSDALCEITGYDRISLQPNSGAQGEYAGLLAIRGYHQAQGQHQRNVCLIPASAHGTNPASAHLAGMEVVVVASDAQGNIDMADLRARIEQVGDRLAALMITHPSTHGVFETTVTEICARVHEAGGQVYLDGANMNAMVGVARPGHFGSDVSHLNLHKTFCIPHGGGGPGVGPVAVRAHLAPYLPGVVGEDGRLPAGQSGPVSAAPFGSASILPISLMYILMMGASGLRQATQVAILNANYLATRLAPHYPLLYAGPNGRVAHECILDIRPIKDRSGIGAEDIAKR
ncbi:aminomethyl-transferring glycine dehydrogenase, partial [Castellaniella sp.]|uniref:aminomethyl-transferring glycine dehydrogenase n=1 Tax=Castellaniella sp. TaxID=1955812 RepID=UPI0035693186